MAARCYMAAHALPEALEAARVAAQLEPQFVQSQWVLFQVLTKLKRPEEGVYL